MYKDAIAHSTLLDFTVNEPLTTTSLLINLCNGKDLKAAKGDMYLIQLASAYQANEEFMDTTTNAAGEGSSAGKAFYLKNAKAIAIEITPDITADAAACHSINIDNYYTFPSIRTDREAGVLIYI